MNKNKRKYNFSNRIIFVLVLIMLLVLVYLVRLLQLQVFGGEQYKTGAIEQKRTVVKVAAERGDIYDRNGNVLAQTVTVNTCYLFPKIFKQNKDTESYINELSSVLGLEKAAIKEKIDSNKDRVVLKKRLSQEEVDLVNKIGLTQSIKIEKENSRFYPNGETGSRLIGYTDLSNEGLYGIEKEANDELSGKKGIQVYSRDSKGYIIPYESYEEYTEEDGNNVVLTIDGKLQDVAYKVAKEGMEEFSPEKLSIIITDPNTGQILAMETLPTYDKNNPRNLTDDTDLSEDEKLNDLYSLWSNPAVSDLYEPGSVFKVITTSVALEEKAVDENSTFVCNGSLEVAPGVTIKCWRYWNPHGTQTLSEALGNSCNPSFVQIINKVGLENYYDYLDSLNLTRITGIDLPTEQNGMVDNYEDIGPVEFATMSYGHGISLTPIQVIQAVNTAVNGGYYYKPYVIDRYEDTEGNIVKKNQPEMLTQVFSNETSSKVRDLLVNNVENGASNAVLIDGYTIGGKSGTTDKLIDGNYDNDETISSFYSCYPGNDPKYSILIVVDSPKGETGGNAVAGKLSKKVLSEIIEIEKGLELENKQTIKLPNLIDLSVEEAKIKLDEKGILYKVIGEYNNLNPVISQSIKGGETISTDKTIELKSDNSKLVVIDFSDIDESTLKDLESIYNIKYEQAEEFSQSIEKGTIIDKDEEIIIYKEKSNE